MTKYPHWRRKEIQKKWQSMLAVFITTALVFAILNGLLKSFSVGGYLGDSSWDSKSSLPIVLNTSPPAVFVFQKDPKRIAFLTINEDLYLPTGDKNNPLEKVSKIITTSAEDFSRAMSVAFGSKIEKYIIFENSQKIDQTFAKNFFKNLLSITAPIAILSGKMSDEFMKINLTRIDMIKLWWQLKSVSVNDISLVDFSDSHEEIVGADGTKVLGVDTGSLHRGASRYLENLEIVNEGFNIRISNASGVDGAGSLAADFAGGVGAKVVAVDVSQQEVANTFLAVANKNPYTVFYLAKIFNCDIKEAPGEVDSGEIQVIIGRDFAAHYLL